MTNTKIKNGSYSKMKTNEYLLDKDFFKDVVAKFKVKSIAPKKIIVVEHAVIDTVAFLQYLGQKYQVYFIPKPKSIDKNVLRKLDSCCKILNVNRKQLCSENIISFLKNIVCQDPFAIIDIGGYFAPILSEIEKAFSSQLLKIIEDTENGYQKYENTMNKFSSTVPILSVARSPLKVEEDYLVGQEIVIKSEIALADCGTTLLGKRALVIGFGKIGSSIADNLYRRGSIVYVADKKAIRLANAMAKGFQISHNFYHDLDKVNLVYIANGEKSVDLLKLKKASILNTLYVFSVTSSEDTYSHVSLLNELPSQNQGIDYRIMQTTSNKNIMIANSGNAINFAYTIPTLASYVQLTHLEMAVMLTQDFIPENRILTLNKCQQEKIAQLWIDSVG